MSTPEKKSRGGGRVAFLKHRDAIKQKIEAGHVRRHIYDDIPDLGISYSQFIRYVNHFITPGDPNVTQAAPQQSRNPRGQADAGPGTSPPSPARPEPAQPGTSAKPASTSERRSGAQPRLQHTSAASKDELVG